jgi:hypothetical protein
MRLALCAALAGAILTTGALAAGPPDYGVTPLTKADVDFYLDILRAAAAHNAHLTGDDKAAVDLAVQYQKHPPAAPTGMPTPAQMQQMTRTANLMARAAELASYDEKIAEQRGMQARYDEIKGEMEGVVAVAQGVGASCGGDCGGSATAAQIARGKQEEAALKADKPLVTPHIAEIKALKKQIGGFMFGEQ